MKNVQMTVDGGYLRINIDLTAPSEPSKSGKSLIIASTEGNKTVPGTDVKIGLNVYKPAKN